MNNKVKFAFAMGTFIILSLIGCTLMHQNDDVVFYTNDEEKQLKTMVYVVGEVNEPGVYEVSEDTRIYEAIEMAGGATEDADLTRLNLVKIISDEEKINVPKKIIVFEEVNSDDTHSGLININTASAQTLSTLNGIGKSTAEKIVQYRTENGYFDEIEDIMKVSGIGESKFNNIKNDITT